MGDLAEYCKELHEQATLRDFLHSLYSLHQKKTLGKRQKLLEGATIAQLDFTLRTLYHILNKDIFIAEHPHGDEIKKRGLIPYLVRHFGDRKSVVALLRSAKKNKVEALLPIHSFHQLFWMLFNRKE